MSKYKNQINIMYIRLNNLLCQKLKQMQSLNIIRIVTVQVLKKNIIRMIQMMNNSVISNETIRKGHLTQNKIFLLVIFLHHQLVMKSSKHSFLNLAEFKMQRFLFKIQGGKINLETQYLKEKEVVLSILKLKYLLQQFELKGRGK